MRHTSADRRPPTVFVAAFLMLVVSWIPAASAQCNDYVPGPVSCLGDLNNDCKVDDADLEILWEDFGCENGCCAGDLNLNGKTDSSDLGQLLSEMSTGCMGPRPIPLITSAIGFPVDFRGTSFADVDAAVSPDGDIQNVFNNGGPKGAGVEALISAIRAGGNPLDCYDGHLSDLYSQVGFEETGRMKFNREYAPAGWDYNKYDDPDVVFMALPKGKFNESEARERATRPKEQWEPHVESTRYYTDWDTAKVDSRGAVRNRLGGANQRPGMGRAARPIDRRSGIRDWHHLV